MGDVINLANAILDLTASTASKPYGRYAPHLAVRKA
jgi:hypothetical protein